MEVEDCLIKCQGENCSRSKCCLTEFPSEFDDDDDRPEKPKLSFSHGMQKHLERKEIIPASPPINLRRFTLHKLIDDDGRPNDSDTDPPALCRQVSDKRDNATCTIDVHDTTTITGESEAQDPQILVIRPRKITDDQGSESCV